MNKGFFMVFLGIIVGAMALIFFNQASQPTAVTAPGRAVADAVPAPPPPPVTPAPSARPAESAKPLAEASKPAPEAVKPEQSRPEQSRPEQAKPDQPKPDQPGPDSDKAAQTAAPAKPEPAPAPEAPAPATPAKPEPPATPAQTASAPVPDAPEMRVNPEKPRKSLTLRNIGLYTKNNGVALRIEADGPFSYKTFALPTPERYVVDLTGKWSGMRAPKVPANMLVKSARVGSQSGGPRLVLDLQRAPRKHDVVWISPTVLEIRLE